MFGILRDCYYVCVFFLLQFRHFLAFLVLDIAIFCFTKLIQMQCETEINRRTHEKPKTATKTTTSISENKNTIERIIKK